MIPNTSETQIGAESATPQLDPAVQLLANFARITVRLVQQVNSPPGLFGHGRVRILAHEERQCAEALLIGLLGRQPTIAEIAAVVNW